MLFCLEKVSLIVCFILCICFANAAYSKEAFPIIWNVQNSNQYYVGRNALLTNIHSAFINKHEVAIVGSAGIGKTQLAKKYAETYRNRYDIIWWLDVGKNLDYQYLELVLEWNRAYANEQINTYLPKDEMIKQMKDCLRVANKNWLLIFDNVTDKDQLTPYTPNKHNDKSLGHILITSKNPYTWSHAMKLDKFTRAESVELLQMITRDNDAASLDVLAKTLGDYPLAIVQAASYIKSHPGLSMHEYTQLFLTSREKLWAEESRIKSKHAAYDNYEHTVFTTLSLIVAEIKKESLEAFEMLAFCSYLNSKNIPEFLLQRYADEILKSDTISFRKSLSILGKYSLISYNTSQNPGAKDKDATFIMHELTQLTVQDMLGKNEKNKQIKKALQATGSLLSNKLDVFVPFLVAHPSMVINIESVAKAAIDAEVYDNDLLLLEQRLFEYYLSGKRDFPVAKTMMETIEQVINKISNPNPVLKARFTIMKSSYLAWHDFDYPASLKQALDALELLKNLPDHAEEQLMARNRLAQLYQLMGDTENALIYAKQGLELIKRHPDVGNQDALYQTLSRVHLDEGDFKSAMEYVENSISKLSLNNGKPIAGQIPIYITKSTILIKMKKYQEALEYLEDLNKKADLFFGQNDHLYKAIINCYYGYVLYLQGSKLPQSKKLLVQSQEMLIRLFGENSKNKTLANTHGFLGEIYEKEGNNIKAQAEYAKALQVIINSYNGSSPAIDDFSDLYTRLAIINAKLEEPVTAQHYLNLHRKHFGNDHPRTNEITDYFVENNMAVGF